MSGRNHPADVVRRVVAAADEYQARLDRGDGRGVVSIALDHDVTPDRVRAELGRRGENRRCCGGPKKGPRAAVAAPVMGGSRERVARAADAYQAALDEHRYLRMVDAAREHHVALRTLSNELKRRGETRRLDRQSKSKARAQRAADAFQAALDEKRYVRMADVALEHRVAVETLRTELTHRGETRRFDRGTRQPVPSSDLVRREILLASAADLVEFCGATLSGAAERMRVREHAVRRVLSKRGFAPRGEVHVAA